MLNADNLGHYYSRREWLFRHVNFSLDSGEILAILGPNARGKTTFLTCLSGVRTPAEGSVTTEGGVGYVPQNHATAFQFSVFDIVLMGRTRAMKLWSTPRQEDYEASWHALNRVGLSDHAGDLYTDLSGGQRQLVLIARALVCDPAILILDEPTSALDLKNQRLTLSILHELAAEGIAVVFSTHDPTHALQIADSTLLMDTELSLGPTSQQLTESTLSQLYQTPIKTADVAFESGVRTVVVPDLATTKG